MMDKRQFCEILQFHQLKIEHLHLYWEGENKAVAFPTAGTVQAAVHIGSHTFPTL